MSGLVASASRQTKKLSPPPSEENSPHKGHPEILARALYQQKIQLQKTMYNQRKQLQKIRLGEELQQKSNSSFSLDLTLHKVSQQNMALPFPASNPNSRTVLARYGGASERSHQECGS